MMKKRIIATLLTAVMAISLMACGGGSSSASTSSGAGDTAASGGAAGAGSGNAEYTIKIGHSDTTTNLIHVSLENLAKYVNEQSGGKVKVDIYAAEQLGSNAEMAEMVEMGSLDAMMLPQGQSQQNGNMSGTNQLDMSQYVTKNDLEQMKKELREAMRGEQNA